MNQIIDESPQTLPSVHPTCNTGDENSFTHDSKPNFVDDSPNVFNPPPQPLCILVNFAGKRCRSQQEKKETAAQGFIPYWNFSMIDDEEARDNFLKDVCTFLRKFSRIPFGVTPKVILIAWESFGKIKDALMDKQYQQEDIQELMSKLLEDVRNISEEFSEYINCPSWNRPLFYFDDDDDEYTVIWRRPKAITPDEPSEEPEDPLIMGEEELSTIPEKDKSSVEDLVPIPSGSKGVSDDICDNDHSDAESLLSQDIPITSPKIDFLSEEFAGELAPIPPGMDEDEFDEEEDDCYDDDTSSDDDSYENIEYVEASPPDFELVSLEEVNEDQEEKEFDLEDIFQIQDVILREKLLNVHRLITNIESLKNNPTPDHVFKSPFSFPIPITDSDSFFEESNTSFSHLDNSLPEFETFSDHTEETRVQTILMLILSFPSMIHLFLSFLEFESFTLILDPSFLRPPPEASDIEIRLIVETDAQVINNVAGGFDVEDDDSFTFVIWTFLLFLTYPDEPKFSEDSRVRCFVPKLNGSDNYGTWKRSMLIALSAKNKLKLINDKYDEPPVSSDLRAYWERANAMLISWILNTVSEHIDVHMIYQIANEIVELKKSNYTIEVYYHKLKGLWDKIYAIEASYACTWGQTLLMQPLPIVAKAYNMLRQEEKQRDSPQHPLTT
ncbi:putative reverse transcriptase, RNA-dependent DNA polymerase, LTR copia-type gag-polypeptide [Tanacetum coccineum]